MKRHTTWVGLLVIAALFALPAPGAAQKPSCKDCEWKDCLKGSIQQKQALKAEYDALTKKWEKFWTEGRKPLYVLDLEKLSKPQRQPALQELGAQFRQFAKDEERATSKIGPPSGCGLDSAESIEMETDSVKCEIDMLKARKTQQALPCKDLYDIAFRHEAYHLEQCWLRRGGDETKPPSKLLTPAGKAKEEAAAYAREIAELEAVLKSIQSGVDYEGVSTLALPAPVGTIVYESEGNLEFKVDDKGKITGKGVQTFKLRTSGSSCSFSGFMPKLEMTVRGKKTGNILDFTLWYTNPRIPPPLLATCPKVPQPIPLYLPITMRSFKIENKEGAKHVVDFATVSGGKIQGLGISTLNSCPE